MCCSKSRDPVERSEQDCPYFHCLSEDDSSRSAFGHVGGVAIVTKRSKLRPSHSCMINELELFDDSGTPTRLREAVCHNGECERHQ